VSIGVEIMNMPSLIFLDEPTSGLDSVISHEVMSFVHKIASQNRTIIATIHQVGREALATMDQVSTCKIAHG
jgi:ABC-type multidrug transport system ATPase subunit